MTDDDDERLERVEQMLVQIRREMEDLRMFIHQSRVTLERLSADLDRKLSVIAGRMLQ